MKSFSFLNELGSLAFARCCAFQSVFEQISRSLDPSILGTLSYASHASLDRAGGLEPSSPKLSSECALSIVAKPVNNLRSQHALISETRTLTLSS